MPAELLNNRYRLEAEIGRGGMGSVYRAHDTLLDRSVAVKVLTEADVGSPGRQRLLREAKAAARLNHPNIVSVYDAGTSDGVGFVVMEYVEGTSLHKLRPQGIGEIVSVALQVATALDHAHSHSIIHRDLKPENVMVTPDGTAKLMDFGLARSIASRVTTEGNITGTVFYLSPEQALGQPVDGRADLYSLGVMLYELTAGRLPFVADDPLAIISQHLHAPPVPPSTYNEQIPPLLEALILSLMGKVPEDRPASAADVIRTLQQVVGPSAKAEPSEGQSLLDRVVRGRLVGRAQELSEARMLWQQAASGEARVLLISGEPGIGKTRLARELASQVAVTGGIVLSGECYAEGSAPFAPMGQVIHQAVDRLSGDGSALSEFVLSDLIRLAPSLKNRYPNVPPNPTLEPQAEQQQLCEAVMVLFTSLSQKAPVLLVIEDAHWADGGTLSLLRHLTHRAHTPDLHLLTVLTYREVELDEARALHDMLQELNRERLATRLKLPRLTREQTGEMLAVMFQREITPEFLDGIYRETEGNPFFVEEVCKALIDQGKLFRDHGRWERGVSVEELDIPQNLKVAIRSRVSGLPEKAQEVLRRASIIGREFDWGILKEISDLDEDTLIDALESAEKAQLIEEVHRPGRPHPGTAQRFAFVHALVQLALQESVIGLRRQRLHGRVAAALERLHPDELDVMAPRLGRHFAEAGEWDKAVRYLLVAGDRAMMLFAYTEAVDSYTEALTILKERKEYEQAARTAMKLGLAHHTIFNFKESRQAYQEGFALWQRPATESATELSPAPHAFRMTWQDLFTLDPSLAHWSQECFVIANLFSGLVEQTPEMDIIPDGARAWEVLEGGRKYIFHLRNDLHWSDGVPLTAHDFELSCKRTLDPQLHSHIANYLEGIRGARAFHAGEVPTADEVGVKAVDDLTLTVELERPAGYFLRLIAMLYPVPRHVVEKYGAAWTDPANIVTNGPFGLETWKPGERLDLERNPTYHGRFPGNLQRVELRLVSRPDWPRTLERYEADAEDLIEPPPEEIDRARYRHPGEYVQTPVAGTGFVLFDTTKPPFDDPRVRQAFAQSLDRGTMADVNLHGYFSPGTGGVVPPGVPGHSPDIGLPLDVERAKRLLAESGFPGGRGFPAVQFGVPVFRLGAGEFIQSQWRANLGVEVGLQEMPWREYTVGVIEAPPPIYAVGWIADYPDPDNILRLGLGAYMMLRPGEEFLRRVAEAGQSTNQEERTAMYQEADRLLVQQALAVPLFYVRNHYLIKPWVKRYPASPVRECFWNDVVLEAH
jgi:ABC-type oligopeptide transport system substrate-binding subunit/predicted Ser/Thr protein kinase